jgi:Domain of unknown function (DUF4352)
MAKINGVKIPKSGNWFKRHKILTVFGGLVVLGFIISVSSSGSQNNGASASVSNTPSNSAKTAAVATPAKQQAKVGDTITIGGAQGIAVNLSQIIDPAQGSDQYTTPDAGKHFVGVKIQVTNNGTSGFQDDVNNDVTIIGSDNQNYTADFNAITGCTNFSDGSFTLASGASTTGCVTFQLPNGVTSAKVQFAPNSGFSGDTGEWTTE